jgi:redox-regulated HSP33 family molecular chaperone
MRTVAIRLNDEEYGRLTARADEFETKPTTLATGMVLGMLNAKEQKVELRIEQVQTQLEKISNLINRAVLEYEVALAEKLMSEYLVVPEKVLPEEHANA